MLPTLEFFFGEFERLWDSRGRLSPQAHGGRLRSYRREWSMWGAHILTGIAQLTGVRWKEKMLECQVRAANSDGSADGPLCVPGYKDPTQFVDILTHELIHVNISYAPREGEQGFELRLRRHPHIVRQHVLVHAVHGILLKRLFGEERYLRERVWARTRPDYDRAWRIAEIKGFERVTEEFRSFLKIKAA